MSLLFVSIVLLIALSHWDKSNKRKRPDYITFQMKENLRNMFK